MQIKEGIYIGDVLGNLKDANDAVPSKGCVYISGQEVINPYNRRIWGYGDDLKAGQNNLLSRKADEVLGIVIDTNNPSVILFNIDYIEKSVFLKLNSNHAFIINKSNGLNITNNSDYYSIILKNINDIGYILTINIDKKTKEISVNPSTSQYYFIILK